MDPVKLLMVPAASPYDAAISAVVVPQNRTGVTLHESTSRNFWFTVPLVDAVERAGCVRGLFKFPTQIGPLARNISGYHLFNGFGPVPVPDLNVAPVRVQHSQGRRMDDVNTISVGSVGARNDFPLDVLGAFYLCRIRLYFVGLHAPFLPDPHPFTVRVEELVVVHVHDIVSLAWDWLAARHLGLGKWTPGLNLRFGELKQIET